MQSPSLRLLKLSFFCEKKEPDHSLNPRKLPHGLISFLTRQLTKNRLVSHRNSKKISMTICKQVVSQQLNRSHTIRFFNAQRLLADGKCREMKIVLESLIAEGYTLANANMAVLLAHGMDGIKANHVRMHELLRRGISKNCHHCIAVSLGGQFDCSLKIPHVDPVRCLELASASAERGSMYGIYARGCCYAYGYDGEKDWDRRDKKAYEEFEKAAQLGHPSALSKLAVAHYGGNHDYEKDMITAFGFHQAAATHGCASSLSILGLMLSEGEIGPPDYDQAIYWLERAVGAEENDCVPNYGYTTAAEHLDRVRRLKQAAELANPHKKFKN
jgi:TPR repeat protein